MCQGMPTTVLVIVSLCNVLCVRACLPLYLLLLVFVMFYVSGHVHHKLLIFWLCSHLLSFIIVNYWWNGNKYHKMKWINIYISPISATWSYHSYDLVADLDFAQCNKVKYFYRVPGWTRKTYGRRYDIVALNCFNVCKCMYYCTYTTLLHFLDTTLLFWPTLSNAKQIVTPPL